MSRHFRDLRAPHTGSIWIVHLALNFMMCLASVLAISGATNSPESML
jgi:hypothetical protein